MGKLGDIEKIVSHSRHYLSRFVIIVKAKGELLQMAEHITAHLSLHFNTHYMPLILNKILQKHTNKIKY